MQKGWKTRTLVVFVCYFFPVVLPGLAVGRDADPLPGLQPGSGQPLHHGRGIHQYNYSDLPLFDILFGTFRNPRELVSESGFYDGASAKVPQILVFKDIAGRDFDPAMKL